MNADAQSSETTDTIRNAPTAVQTLPTVIRRDEQYTIDALNIQINPATNNFCMDISGTSIGSTSSTQKPTKMSLNFCSRPEQKENPTTANPVMWAQRLDIIGKPRANTTRFRMNAGIGFEPSFNSAEKAVLITQPVASPIDTTPIPSAQILALYFSSKSTEGTIMTSDKKPVRDPVGVLKRLIRQVSQGVIIDGFIEHAERRVIVSQAAIPQAVSPPTPGLKP